MHTDIHAHIAPTRSRRLQLRSCALAVVCCLLAPFLALDAAESLDDATLQRVKAATVYVKNELGTGSGFLIHRSGPVGHIATNRHVISDQNGRSAEKVQVVFNSVAGRESAVDAKIVAVASDTDVAILRIERPGFPLPEPLEVDLSVELRETLPVFVFGFPFGDAFAVEGGYPAVTVGGGSISSFRRDKAGVLRALQVDGDLNPGNSGGPIVTSKGDLVGIATATVIGTQLGLAVPGTVLADLLEGSSGAPTLTATEISERRASYQVEVPLMDPLEKIRKATMYVVPKAKVPTAPRADAQGGGFALIAASAKPHALEIEDGVAIGEVTVFGHGEDVDYYFQVCCRTDGGTDRFDRPIEHVVCFGSQTLATEGKAEKAARRGHRQIDGGGDETTGVVGTGEEEEPGGPIITFPEGEPEKITRTPKPIVDAIPARYGEYLVLRYQGLPALAVYDLKTRSVLRTIKLPTRDFLYTVGHGKALVYAKENNLLMAVDLESGDRLKTKPSPVGAVVCSLTMGYGNDSVALVRYALGKDALDNAGNYLLDVGSLKQIPFAAAGDKRSTAGRNSSYRDYVHRRSDAGLTLISEWCTSHSPQGLGVYRRSHNSLTSAYEHTSEMHIAVGDDGRLYTGGGRIYNGRLRKIGELRGMKLFPAVGGAMYVGISDDGKMSVYAAGTTTPLAPIGEFPELPKGRDPMRSAWDKTPYTFDRRILLNPRLGQLVLLPTSDDRIVQRTFNLKSILSATGIDYLFTISSPPSSVTVGEEISYQVKSLSKAGGVKYKLEFGPSGMRISDTGLLTWSVPGSAANTSESVIVLIEDAGGESVYHSFDLTIEPR